MDLCRPSFIGVRTLGALLEGELKETCPFLLLIVVRVW